MYRILMAFLLLTCLASSSGAAPVPIHLWYEPEWFDGVQGGFAYWTGTAKPTGAWSVAGPGISPEWTQGGESEWNSAGVPASESRAECRRDFVVPRAGKYRIWVRFVDHRKKKAPFTILVESGAKAVARAELGTKAVVPVNDEWQLYWGFSFGWGSFDADLPAGPARLRLVIDKKGEAWRQIDAILLTTDLTYEPVGREKPPFAYLEAMHLRPADGRAWRGVGLPAPTWARPKLGGRDFSMWTGVDGDAKWWSARKVETMTTAELFHAASPPADIRAAFLKQYPRAADTPLINWPHLLPGLYLGASPNLSPGTPLFKWLARTKSPFFIMTNYATPTYDAKTGPATYAALTGPLAGQFLGYIHGEALGTVSVSQPDKALGKSRAEHLAGFARHLSEAQAKQHSAFYRTKVPAEHRAKSIPCLSVDSTALAHFFHETGCKVVGYEEDSTNFHVPMRIAFQRGAARQYGGSWINYASGNFGDACNYFTQEPQVPRGAKSWYHSKYAVTDGVSAAWYRKMYYLNYLSGAAAIYWEQNLTNQWILPGPGTHPIDLSPFGRGTDDFMAFVSRLGDRGEPVTPIAVLLSHAHGYEPVSYACRMLHFFPKSAADRELRETFNVAWAPAAVAEGKPAAPDVQSLPSGKYGNIFDILVDRPARARTIFSYPIVWAAGHVDLSGTWPKLLEEYVTGGGTFVVNIEAGRKLPAGLLGLVPTGKEVVAESWRPDGGKDRSAVGFAVAGIKLNKATVLAWAGDKLPLITRHAVGKGAVIVTLVPRMLGLDERAHPALPFLLNGLTDRLIPIEARRGDGERLSGEVMVQINRTKDGYLVALVNNRGVDKTPNGVARVDRRKYVDVVVHAGFKVKAAREMTTPRSLEWKRESESTTIKIRVHPGDVQVVRLTRE